MTTTSTDLARETAIARLAAAAAFTFGVTHADCDDLALVSYEAAYRDALTRAWPVLEAARGTRQALAEQPDRPPSLSLQFGVLTAALTAFDI